LITEMLRYFVARMAELNYRLVATETPIVPIWLGYDDRAEKLAAAIAPKGYTSTPSGSQPYRSNQRGFGSK
jgi:hypothetical protein